MYTIGGLERIWRVMGKWVGEATGVNTERTVRAPKPALGLA